MELAKIFNNHMVFPANKPVRIFGKSNGSVTIDFLNKSYSTIPVEGKWEITLPAMKYGGPYFMRICADGKTIELVDIMVGEVILIAGQSNLQFTIQNEGTQVLENNNQLRFFVSDRIEKYEGIKSTDGWVRCDENTIKNWSAVGFYIAKHLFIERNIAVGIVGCYQGASNIQSWMSKNLASEERFYIPKEDAHWDFSAELYSEWNQPGKLFEHTFLPIVPYTFSAVVWYQGESNTSLAEANIYADMLQALIGNWRNCLKNPYLPFIIVQICDFDDRDDEGWHGIQQAQIDATQHIEKTWLVTSSDVCAHFDVHPPKKQALGEKIGGVLDNIL